MLRNSFIIFLLGWVAWFWIDKPPPEQMRLPEVSDSLVENFQVAFDMLKSGYPNVAFVYIWNAHYLLLSILGGVLLSVAVGAVSDALARRRMRRRIMPPSPVVRKTDSTDDTPQAQRTVPTDESSSSG
jgi:hypothetical protein